jgi:hypothetical protein
MLPSKLIFDIHSYMPGSAMHGVYLDNGELFVFSSDTCCDIPPKEQWRRINQPEEADWERFYQALCDIQVKKWDKQYVNHRIIDGGGWSLNIRFRDIYRSTEGMNAYPEPMVLDGQEVDPFDLLYDAVDQLTGGELSASRNRRFGD